MCNNAQPNSLAYTCSYTLKAGRRSCRHSLCPRFHALSHQPTGRSLTTLPSAPSCPLAPLALPPPPGPQYSEFLPGWLAVWPRDRFLFLRSEDYKQAPAAHVRAAVKFLGRCTG